MGKIWHFIGKTNNTLFIAALGEIKQRHYLDAKCNNLFIFYAISQ